MYTNQDSVIGARNKLEEILRIISADIDKAQEARLEISRTLLAFGVTKNIEYPDIATKEKAQKYIGIEARDQHSERPQTKLFFLLCYFFLVLA